MKSSTILVELFFYLCINNSLMKIKIIKEVYSQSGWRREGDILELDAKTTRHYLAKGIAVEHKEEKAVKETKEAKAPRKRATKNVSSKNK